MKTIYQTTQTAAGKIQTPIGTIVPEYSFIVLQALRKQHFPMGDKAPLFHAE